MNIVVREYRRNANNRVVLVRCGRGGVKWRVEFDYWRGGQYHLGLRKFYTAKADAFAFYDKLVRDDAVYVATLALRLSTAGR